MVCLRMRHGVAWIVALALLLTAAWSVPSVAQSGRKRESPPRQYEPAKPKLPPANAEQTLPKTPAQPGTAMSRRTPG